MIPPTNRVVCPPPTRPREDDRIVETFLNAYEDGRFAYRVDWLPQHVSNVEAIASTEDGTKLAIEHTCVQEFGYFIGREPNQPNPDEDPILGEIGAHFASISLPVRDREFMLNVDPKNLKRLLTYKKYRPKTLDALTEWAQKFLPSLRENQEFEISVKAGLPHKDSIVRIGVEVFRVPTNRPILGCCGYLPPRPDIVSRVRKALEDKLPKLVRTQANRRILMLELVTLAGDSEVYETLLNVARDLAEFLKIDELVFARNFWDLGAVFRTWNTASNEWSAFVAQVSDEGR